MHKKTLSGNTGIGSFFRRHLFYFVTGPISMIVEVAMTIILPKIADIINKGTLQGDSSYIIVTGLKC